MSAIQEADIQLTDERKRLSIIEDKIRVGLATVSKRPETTLALRSVQLAFMWLGKAKGHLGITNPYPNSTNAGNKIIEPAVDRAENFASVKFEDEIFFCKSLRDELNGIAKAIENDTTIFVDRRMYQVSIETAYVNAENAKMWLGIILGQIRNEQQNQNLKTNETGGTESDRNDNNRKRGGAKSLLNKIADTITGGSSADKAPKAGRKTGR